ncbi:MAG TPA: hypothetical protein VNQ99_14530, partial [Xanthobacteraceae bacterium]|nr:hypothetical protein [Xanthobacteraceae bacterium]
EIAPIILLLAGCVALTVQADPVLRYMNAAASAAHSPADYVRGVLTDPETGAVRSPDSGGGP